jgi:MinD superfamily P-loop ATPase
MKLAVASGKGGTGKTTVATNLAWVAAQDGRSVVYRDCDVEEPNGAIFLSPEWQEDRGVASPVPNVDQTRCIGCGKCGEICQFSAILPMKNSVLTFPELCHACGGCWEVCPAGAITRGKREIGRLLRGTGHGVTCIQGVLNVGEAMSPPLIRQVKQVDAPAEFCIADCPPGTSCPVIEAIRGNHYVLLVTEPTPFGLSDLRLAVQTVRMLNMPFGVVINRADSGDDRTRHYCREERIRILAEIPDIRGVAEAYSCGRLAAEASSNARRSFHRLLKDLHEEMTS